MFVKDRMNKNVIVAKQDFTLGKALNLMNETQHKRLPVVDDNNQPIGVVNQNELAEIIRHSFIFNKTKVIEVVGQGFFKIKQDALLEDCALVMKDNKTGFLPVVDNNNQLVGIITSFDVLKGMMNLLDICGEGGRVIIKGTENINEIVAVMSEAKAEISSISKDNEDTIVKFYAKNSDAVKVALENKFDIRYFMVN